MSNQSKVAQPVEKSPLPPAGVRSVAGCLLVQLCVGILYLWSVLKAPVVQSLGLTASTAGMMASYMLMGFVGGGLVGGLLTDKLGQRITCVIGVCVFAAGIGSSALLTASSGSLLVLTYAICGGLGSGIAYSACISCIQKWMPKRKGLASGLAIGAFGLSTVVFVPVIRGVMGLFTVDGLVNFHGVFAVLGGGFFVVGMLGCLLIRRPPEAPRPAGEKEYNGELGLGEAVRTRAFWCLFFIVFFINGAWNIATPMIYDLGLARGLSPESAALALSLTGIANTAGRLIMAVISDKLGRSRTLLVLSLMTVAAALLLIFVRGVGYIAMICVLAYAYGGPSSINAAFTADLFGGRHAASIYGVALLALGASSMFFNFLAANVLGGNVTASFIMGAASAVIPIILMVYMALARFRLLRPIGRSFAKRHAK